MPPTPSTTRLIDITRPVAAGIPVWPGDAPYRLEWSARRAGGWPANVARVSHTVHLGTHADAPHHVLDDGPRIAAMPLDAYAGPATVLDARGRDEVGAGWLAAALGDARPERVLFRTESWVDPEVFPSAFPGISPLAAQALVDRGVRLVGTDAPSVDPFDSEDLPAHHVLLGAGVAILENLLLDGVQPGEYELTAFPLRLEEADGSPVRAVLRPLP
jgi:arylformamidase